MRGTAPHRLGCTHSTLPVPLRSDLKAIDRYNDKFISATVTPTMDILVLHPAGTQAAVTALAATLRELVVKATLNPLASLDGYITGAAFTAAASAAASSAMSWAL